MSDLRRSHNIFVEFHALTSHAPSNLNRDDLGTPKTALFGGVRRLRISSQCLKRTWRMSSFFRGEFAEENLGIRTAYLPRRLREELTAEGLSRDSVEGLVNVLAALGKKPKQTDEGDAEEEEEGTDEAAEKVQPTTEETAHLLFLSRQEIDETKAFARKERVALAAVFERSSKGKKTEPKVSSEKVQKLRKELKRHLDEKCQRNAVDVALFGRFVTGDEFQTDAAMQVAHALGTQKVEIEYDYFSAVDDLATGPGAGHIGESEFAAAVFYKYAVCDLAQLQTNLGEIALVASAMKGIASAVARAVPTGKKNGTAAQNPADYLEVVVRKDAPVSLANAYLEPVAPRPGDDVMRESIRRLRLHSRRYDEAYGHEEDIIKRLVLCLPAMDLEGKLERLTSLDELATRVQDVVTRQGAVS